MYWIYFIFVDINILWFEFNLFLEYEYWAYKFNETFSFNT